ncbi:unnamed protein product [Absidia cylindrospora]
MYATPTTTAPNPLLPEWALTMRKEMDAFKVVQKDNQKLIEQNNILTHQLQQALTTITDLQEKIKNLEEKSTATLNSDRLKDYPPPTATTTIHDSQHAPQNEKTPTYATVTKKDTTPATPKRLAPSAIRRKLIILGVNTRRIIDIHSPTKGAIGLLLHRRIHHHSRQTQPYHHHL